MPMRDAVQLMKLHVAGHITLSTETINSFRRALAGEMRAVRALVHMAVPGAQPRAAPTCCFNARHLASWPSSTQNTQHERPLRTRLSPRALPVHSRLPPTSGRGTLARAASPQAGPRPAGQTMRRRSARRAGRRGMGQAACSARRRVARRGTCWQPLAWRSASAFCHAGGSCASSWQQRFEETCNQKNREEI